MTDEVKKDDVQAEETSAPAVEETKEEAPTSAEAPKEEVKEEAPVEIPAEFKDLIEKIEKMTVMELNSLVKVLEKKFGVSAQAVAVAGPAAGGEAAEEKDSFTVELKSGGDSKINVIKAVKAALNLGLKEAKDLVDGAPSVLKEGVKKDEAEALKKAVEEAGGSVELK